MIIILWNCLFIDDILAITKLILQLEKVFWRDVIALVGLHRLRQAPFYVKRETKNVLKTEE